MQRRAARLVPGNRADRNDPIVTYKRISDEPVAIDDAGRVEPRFARESGMRRAHIEDIDALPQVEAPPSQAAIDIDELAEPVSTARGRAPARKRGRGGRILALVGILAIIGGAGVLAATYGGIVTLDGRTAAGPVSTSTVVHAAGDAEPVVATDAPAFDASGRAVRVVAAYGNAPDGIAPSAAVAPGDVSGTPTVATAEGRVIVDPPLPRLRPLSASYTPAQPDVPAGDTFGTTAPLTQAAVAPAALPAGTTLAPPTATAAAMPSGDAAVGDPGNVDAVLASVDRILADERARAGTVAPLAPQALPYPVLEPLPGANAYPVSTGVVYGPPAPSLDLAADNSGSLLPQRRVFVVPNAPVPPADIPNTQPNLWGQ